MTTVLSGLEACAAAIAGRVDVAVVVGGEGARRFVHALRATPGCDVRVPDLQGAEAAAWGEGIAAAGARVAFVASGLDAVAQLLPALDALAEGRRACVVLLPCHGRERGRAVPGGPYDDLAAMLHAPVGVLYAASPAELGDGVCAADALAMATRAPWCVAFPLADVGCAMEPCDAPRTVTVAVDPSVHRDGAMECVWEVLRAHGVEGPVVEGAARDRVGAGVGAGAVGVRVLRPWPTLAAAPGAMRVVDEPLPDTFGGDGWLTTQVRAATGATVRARSVDEARAEALPVTVRVACDEPLRTEVARAMVAFAAGLGWRVRAELHRPWCVVLRIAWPGATAQRHLLAVWGALGLDAVMADARGEDVLCVGANDEGARAAMRAMADAVGATVHFAEGARLG